MKFTSKLASGTALAVLLTGCGEEHSQYKLTEQGKELFGGVTANEQAKDKKTEAPQGNGEDATDKVSAEVGGASAKAPELTGEMLNEDRLDLTKKIHALIAKTADPASEAEMKTYELSVPKAGDAKITMVAVPGGEFTIGSPEGEEGRDPDEGPQRKIQVEPMWVCEIEIPWAVYRAYYENGDARKKDGTLKEVEPDTELADLVAQPTPQYMDMFVNGTFSPDDEYPAMEMTNHAANKFCQWLSAQTGHFYRLPTEAEWEYACRAGSTTKYFWGDDASKADEYAWFEDNSDFTYQKVKLKRPNAFGLYDMVGNVSEWTLDQYTADAYKQIEDGAVEPWVVPTTRYPRVFRGGNWNTAVDKLRSASREQSDKELKYQDPQVPKSIWYHTDAQHVGFRIIRPMKTPSAEMMHRYWNTDAGIQKFNQEDLGQ
ncbi:Formylglycine-generating enzyme, required for sulfatase activity, contains SUMF1/FGE domain [Rubritalea squalenifaciens DSM 18772]|uniref:Formylglycine-generating enzyme, required for sulfatase activity, contains SUMF1/FGE domain n=1 Tax=Rubritalea squalenifaciens DSM 18772 TaxID=1123071 RepID=A0A1M6ITE2_9BACT|nr:formylglycine-generating enzyme family protein [Rubritalea squalenifaciens]SHJ37716.1 Formylglycine-generating enzyme, required for sulfatase activity, contains SUMF1/FGE domain [Rubritalea squalenifaciens DSM 18772]